MPWTPDQSKNKTHKANTPTKQRQWAHIADAVLAKTGDEGLAIREASGVVSQYGRYKRKEKDKS